MPKNNSVNEEGRLEYDDNQKQSDAELINAYLDSQDIKGKDLGSVETFEKVVFALYNVEIPAVIDTPFTDDKTKMVKFFKELESLKDFGMKLQLDVDKTVADKLYMDYLKEKKPEKYQEVQLAAEYDVLNKRASSDAKKINRIMMKAEADHDIHEPEKLRLEVLNAIMRGELKLSGIRFPEKMNKKAFEEQFPKLSRFDEHLKVKFGSLSEEEKDNVYIDFMATNFKEELAVDNVEETVGINKYEYLDGRKIALLSDSRHNASGVHNIAAANIVAGEMKGKTTQERVDLFMDYLYRLVKGETVFPGQPQWGKDELPWGDRYNVFADYLEGLVSYAGKVTNFENNTENLFRTRGIDANVTGVSKDYIHEVKSYRDYFRYKMDHDGKSPADFVKDFKGENDPALADFKSTAVKYTEKMLDGKSFYKYKQLPNGQELDEDTTKKDNLSKEFVSKATQYLITRADDLSDFAHLDDASKASIQYALDTVYEFNPELKGVSKEQLQADLSAKRSALFAGSFSKMYEGSMSDAVRKCVVAMASGEKIFVGQPEISQTLSTRERYEKASEYVADLLSYTKFDKIYTKAELDAAKDYEVFKLENGGKTLADFVSENDHWYSRDSKEYTDFKKVALDVENKIKNAQAFDDNKTLDQAKADLAKKAMTYLRHKFRQSPTEADLNNTEKGRVAFAFAAIGVAKPDLKVAQLDPSVKGLIINFLSTQKGLIDVSKLSEGLQVAVAEKKSAVLTINASMDEVFGTDSLSSALSKNHKYFESNKNYIDFENKAKELDKIITGKRAYDERVVSDLKGTAQRYIQGIYQENMTDKLSATDKSRVGFALNCLKLFEPDVSLDDFIVPLENGVEDGQNQAQVNGVLIKKRSEEISEQLGDKLSSENSQKGVIRKQPSKENVRDLGEKQDEKQI